MRAAVTRELIVAARRSAVILIACGLATLLMAFVLIWSPGVSVLAPMNLYQQARLLHWIVLAVALPWTAVRAAANDRGDAFVMMTAFTGLRPATMVVGKVLAMFVLLTGVILTGLPALTIAQQAAAVPIGTVFGDLIPLLGLALLVAGGSTASVLLVSDSLGAWLTSTAVTLAVLIASTRATAALQSVGLVSALAGAACAGWMCARSDRALRHLKDVHAT